MQTDLVNNEIYEKALRNYAEEYHSEKSMFQFSPKKEAIPRYVIYARRSTKSDEQQVASIESQIDSCKELASRENLEVVDILSEKESAKKAGKRIVFYQMLEEIRNGEKYNSIIAWHPDRLARNMKDSGEIMEMLDDGIIADLKFSSFTFNNDASGKMMLNILFAMAKQFSDKLSIDTKRGIRTKIGQGLYSGRQKKGYIAKVNKPFRPDPETFDRIRQSREEAIQGIPYKIILDTTLQGLAFTENTLSYMFKDPFYAGYQSFGDSLIILKDVDPDFVPMVTPQEFMILQTKRKNQLKSNWQKGLENFYPFRGLVRCSYCGGFMTPGASKSSSKNRNRYLYISCRNRNCPRLGMNLSPQTNTIRGYELVDYFIDLLQNHLKVTRDVYEGLMGSEMEEFTSQRDAYKEQIQQYKIQLGKKENTLDILEEKLSNNAQVAERYDDLLNDIRDIKERIHLWEEKLIELDAEIEVEKPKYDEFVNFYKSIVTAIKKTTDPELVDELVKLVCVNFVVDDKKIVSVELKEPFATYAKLESGYGVEDGT